MSAARAIAIASEPRLPGVLATLAFRAVAGDSIVRAHAGGVLVCPRRHLYSVIVSKPDRDAVKPALREWLRNERRLGVRHCRVSREALAPTETTPTPPAAPPRTVAVAVAPALFNGAPGLPPLCSCELTPEEARSQLENLDAAHVRGCTQCRLHESRTQTVFGVGHPRPALVFVGEGPGADEDREGVPFVGRAGQLLTRMIAAMMLTREQVYICNVIKCRPPDNRTPAEDEMETCAPYLWRQLAILRPRVIVALGRPAAQTLLATKAPIGQLRGEFRDFPPPPLAHLGLPPTKVMPTFHPAYLLRSPGEKAKAWEDLKQVMRFLGLRAPVSR